MRASKVCEFCKDIVCACSTCKDMFKQFNIVLCESCFRDLASRYPAIFFNTEAFQQIVREYRRQQIVRANKQLFFDQRK